MNTTATTARTTGPMHPTPSPAAALRAQLRIMAINHRWELIGVATLSFFFAVLLGAVARRRAGGLATAEHISILPEALPPLLLLAGLWALSTWRRDRPSQRGYLLAAPIDRRLHLALRIIAGWGWLMVACMAYLAALGVFTLIVGAPEAFLRDLLARGAVPLVGVTLVYLAATIPTLVSDHPAWWLFGFILGLPIVTRFLHGWLPDAAEPVSGGIESFLHAISGVNPAPGSAFPDSWPGAVLIWGILIGGTVAVALSIRQER